MGVDTARLVLCGRPFKECLKDIERFHGFLAPGLVLGVFMIDLAQKLIGPGVEADAVVETRKCLPDAVQIFTPCTYGNGWMRVLDWNKFALTLYDKHKLNGYRVWLDLDKTKSYPDLYNWFLRRVSKKDLPGEVVNDSIVEAGRKALSFSAVYVNSDYERKKKEETVICSVCGEASAAGQGETCLACRGKGYYQIRNGVC